MIKTTKCPSWVVQTRSSQIQDNGWPPSWKNLKIAISQQWFDRSSPNLAQWRILTVLSLRTPKISTFLQFKMAAAAILKIRKMAISQHRFDRWRTLAVMTLSQPYISHIWKFKMARPPLWKIAKSQQRFNRSPWNLALWHIFVPLDPSDRPWRNFARWCILARWRTASIPAVKNSTFQKSMMAHGRHLNK